MAFLTTSVHEQKTLTSSQTATLQVPPYGKIHSLWLAFRTAGGAFVTEAQARAEVGNIRLTINGKDLINTTVAKLYDIYETLGVRASSPAGIGGVIELNIARLVFIDPVLRDAFGWGTADVNNIQVQVTAGTLTNVASVQAYTGRENVNANLGMYAKIINYPQSFNAAAQHTVDTLPRDLDSDYLMVLADAGASGTQTFGECRVNSATVIENMPTTLNGLALSNTGLAQPASYFVYNFTDGSMNGRLPMKGVSDLRFLNTFSVAPGAAGYNMTAVTLVNAPR